MAVPTDFTLLEKKIKLYMIAAHGGVLPVGDATDSDCFAVSKRLHIIGQTQRKGTLQNPVDPDANTDGAPFYPERWFWKKRDDELCTVRELTTTVIGTLLSDESKKDYGYFPPGCLIRNLKLSRDKNPLVVDGIFEIGQKKPFKVLKWEEGERRVPTEFDNAGIHPEITQLKANTLLDAIKAIEEHGDPDVEKLVLVIACAVKAEGRKGISEKEGEVANFTDNIYHTNMPNEELKMVQFNEPEDAYLAKIAKLLTHNLMFNEKLYSIHGLQAFKYLKGRGLTDEIIEKFNLVHVV